MWRFFKTIIDIVFPPHPLVREAETIKESDFMKDALVIRFSEGVYTCLSYGNKAVRTLIRANKFHRSHHATTLLGAILSEVLMIIFDERALEPKWKHALLTPIPTSKARIRARGYNQVARIIEAISPEMIGTLRYEPHILLRHDRPSQARIEKTKRHKNMTNAFFVPPNAKKRIRGQYIILVDDVTESGATIRDAMRALKDAGAVEIIAVALAK